MMKLVLYSKPGCHLCEGLQEKLEQITTVEFDLEIRDITTRDDWFQAYQYEIPVLCVAADPTDNAFASVDRLSSPDQTLTPLPRPSPRATVQQLVALLQKYRS
jgi:Glutaredoxin-like domain (DUF836)